MSYKYGRKDVDKWAKDIPADKRISNDERSGLPKTLMRLMMQESTLGERDVKNPFKLSDVYIKDLKDPYWENRLKTKRFNLNPNLININHGEDAKAALLKLMIKPKIIQTTSGFGYRDSQLPQNLNDLALHYLKNYNSNYNDGKLKSAYANALEKGGGALNALINNIVNNFKKSDRIYDGQ